MKIILTFIIDVVQQEASWSGPSWVALCWHWDVIPFHRARILFFIVGPESSPQAICLGDLLIVLDFKDGDP